MKLFVVRCPNDYFKAGAYVEKTDDGYQEVEMEQSGNRLQFVRNKGLIFNHHSIPKALQPIMARGFRR